MEAAMTDEWLYAPFEGEQATLDALPPEDGYWKAASKRFLKNKAGLFAMSILIAIVMLCLFGEHLLPFGFQEQNVAIKNSFPSMEHWFGTDQLGRDIFVRVCKGGQVSLEIGIIAAIIVSVVGVVYGSVAGYAGGLVDVIMMRIIEVLKGVPNLIIVILLSILLDVNGVFPLLLALTLTGWANCAQVIRGQVKQLKEKEFVAAAQCLGASTFRIITTHIVPNLMGIIVVVLTLEIPNFIFEEAFLSFIGLGLKNPEVSWGILISLAQPNLAHYPYQIAFPAIAISLTMVALNVFGNAWKAAFDPRQR